MIFIALWIADVHSVYVENEGRISPSQEKPSKTFGDSVRVSEITEDEELEKTPESAIIPDHLVKGVKQDEAVLLDSIRQELDEVKKELEDMRTDFSESDQENIKRDLSQLDPQGMPLFYILPDIMYCFVVIIC